MSHANHDRYDNDILKTLQRIASSLEKIEQHLSNKEDTDESKTEG